MDLGCSSFHLKNKIKAWRLGKLRLFTGEIKLLSLKIQIKIVCSGFLFKRFKSQSLYTINHFHLLYEEEALFICRTIVCLMILSRTIYLAGKAFIKENEGFPSCFLTQKTWFPEILVNQFLWKLRQSKFIFKIFWIMFIFFNAVV